MNQLGGRVEEMHELRQGVSPTALRFVPKGNRLRARSERSRIAGDTTAHETRRGAQVIQFPSRSCKWCGDEFTPSPGKGRPAQFCSEVCRRAIGRQRWADYRKRTNYKKSAARRHRYYQNNLKGSRPQHGAAAGIRLEAGVLRVLLQRANLAQVCRATGVSHRTLIRLKNGQRSVADSTADRLCIYFGLDLYQLKPVSQKR